MARQARRYDIFVLLFIVGSRPVLHQNSAKLFAQFQYLEAAISSA